MDSYKKWKALNESFGPGSFSLGLTAPTNLGLNMGQFSPVSDMLEGKKKNKDDVIVKVSGDDDMDDLDDEDGVIAGEGCGCSSNSGKKSKKKSAKKSVKKSGKNSAKNMDSDMGGDFEEDDGENHDDEDKDDEEKGDDGDGDEEEGDEDKGGKEKPDDAAEEVEGPMFSKKKSGKKSTKKSAKKSGKKSEKKMQKEDTSHRDQWWRQNDSEWMKSVQGMLGAKTDTKYRDGWSEYQEDALLPVANPNAGAEGTLAPLPGQPGFAPSGRLDVGYDSGMSLGEAVKVLEEAVTTAGPKLQKKLIKKLAQLHNRLL